MKQLQALADKILTAALAAKFEHESFVLNTNGDYPEGLLSLTSISLLFDLLSLLIFDI